MKKILFLVFMATSLHASAWVSHEPMEKVYSFKFHLKGEKFEYSQKSATYEEAFERAAKACYQHYKGGRHLSEDTGLDIIDVCANPRTT